MFRAKFLQNKKETHDKKSVSLYLSFYNTHSNIRLNHPYVCLFMLKPGASESVLPKENKVHNHILLYVLFDMFKSPCTPKVYERLFHVSDAKTNCGFLQIFKRRGRFNDFSATVDTALFLCEVGQLSSVHQ